MNQPPRVILHVFQSQSWGGAEIYAVQLAKAQQEQREKVLFWAPVDSPLALEAMKQGLTLISEKLGARVDLSLSRLGRVLVKNQVTHVHLHWSGGMWSFGLAKFFWRFKLILHVHLWLKHSKKDPLHWLLYRNIDKLIVAGEQAKEAALACLPIKKEKIEICPYGMEFGDVTPLKRSALGFSDDQIVFGIFSRLDRQKGIMEFLNALSLLSTEFPQARALIVGEPTRDEKDSINYEEELKSYVDKTFAKGLVKFEGFKKNFREWLATCDVLVVPSYHESYSLIILEAFGLGIPVISTCAGGTPDLVGNERGWLVEPRDVESLRSGLKQILVASHQVGPMGLMARQYVLKNHSFEYIHDRLNKIYG